MPRQHGISRRRDGGWNVALSDAERAVLAGAAAQLQGLLHTGDESLFRLFPPAHPDDREAEEEYRQLVGAGLSEGKRAALASLEGSARQKTLNGDELEIWLAEPDGSRSVQLTSLGLVPGFPRWSPDGGQVAFHADPDGKGDILVVPAAGGKPRNLTANPSSDAFPSFSRDGHWIYFVSNRRGPFSLWKLPTSGGAAIEVKTGARPVGGTVTESVDGASIYYMDGFNKPSSLWQLPVSGGVPVKVVDGVLSFAVLDRGIYYVDRTSDETRLQYIDFATRSSTTVARNLGDLSFGLSASPDGRTILYSRVDSSVDDLMLVENFR